MPTPMTPSTKSLGNILGFTNSSLRFAIKAQLSAKTKEKSERMNTTCSALIPASMITLVVEAFSPNKMAAIRAKIAPRVGCF